MATRANTSAVGRRAWWLAGVALLASPAFASDPQPPGPAEPKRPAQPLDLRIGDIHRYVDEETLGTPIDDELEEIIVNGRRPEPLPEQRVIPQGLGSLIYAVKSPLNAWRVLVPDPNLQIPERTEDDVREPPGAFRAQIRAPGRIFN